MLVAYERLYSEMVLHYIWKRGINIPVKLRSVKGEEIEVLYRGDYNYSGSGPDFVNARIKYKGAVWSGSVEIHIESKEWYLHRHNEDENYNNCILHLVVNSDGRSILRSDGTEVPEVALSNYLNFSDIKELDCFVERSLFYKMPCSVWSRRVPGSVKRKLLREMGVFRIRGKAEGLLKRLERNNFDWFQTLWEALMYVAGSPYNKDEFVRIAKAIRYEIISRYTNSVDMIISMLLGAIGSFRGFSPSSKYEIRLLRNWELLKRKYNLGELEYLRLHYGGRVHNFPSYKLVQISYLLKEFGGILNLVSGITGDYVLELTGYWSEHYDVGRRLRRRIKHIKEFVRRIYLNLSVPYYVGRVMWSGGEVRGSYISFLLSGIGREDNHIVREVSKNLSIKIRDGLESQGAIHLYGNMCVWRRCGGCGVYDYIVREL